MARKAKLGQYQTVSTTAGWRFARKMSPVSKSREHFRGHSLLRSEERRVGKEGRYTRCLSDWSSDVCSSDLDSTKPSQQRRGGDLRVKCLRFQSQENISGYTVCSESARAKSARNFGGGVAWRMCRSRCSQGGPSNKNAARRSA